MRRAEVAAMTLALSTLRRAVLWGRSPGDREFLRRADRSLDAARGLLDHGYDLDEAGPCAEIVGAILDSEHEGAARIRAARVALYLRAVLRAERGDDGTFVGAYCRRCEASIQDHITCCRCARDYLQCPCEPDMVERRARFRPLWLDAKPHEDR